MAFLSGLCLKAKPCEAEDWTRFRGPNGTGIAADASPLPTQIGPDENLLWKTPTPDGISSPVVAGGRVYITATDAERKLTLIALDTVNGQIVWQREIEAEHPIRGKRLATPSPTADHERVICFFDASGLICFDRDGVLQWKKSFGPLENQFNHSASPILVDDRVILLIDHDGESFVAALDKKSGEEVWRSYRFVFGRNYSTPVIWEFDNRRYLVVAGSGVIAGYDLESGTPAWYFRGAAAVVNPTPLVGDNGRLYTHGSSPPGGAKSTPFGQLLQVYDKNRDQNLQVEELPPSFLKTFFARFDRNKNGGVDGDEYEQFEEISQPFVGGMISILPGGQGDLSETNHAWQVSRSMPRTPSALFYQGVLFVVNEGGVLQTFKGESGELIKSARLSARGKIYGSPALGDNKIYLGDLDGNVSVVSATGEWENLHSAKLDSEIQSSPAIAEGRIYFRTSKAVYCFGLSAD